MKNLFRFIIKYNFFFLFLILETVALVLVFRHNHFQRAAFASSSNFLVGGIYSLRSDITDYFGLRGVNRHLATENTRLLEEIPISFFQRDDSLYFFEDTVYQQRFEYVNATVINNSINRRNNFLTLDIGSDHGIEPNMGVITFSGPVGIVASVSRNFSTVISVLNTDFQASVRIKRNDYVGSLIWNGRNHRLADMVYLPGHIELQVGDTVLTSGLSTLFPPNILVGTIIDYEIQRGGNFYVAQVLLSQNFNKLRYVQVVRNLFLDEQLELERSN